MTDLTTFLSFTPSGGRFGRIAWLNSNDTIWGRVRWDHWWPRNRLTPAGIAKAAAAAAMIGQSLASIGVSARQAEESLQSLSAAMAKANA